MTKPMYCPMAFYAGEKEWINHNGKLDIHTKKMECTPDCALAVKWTDGNCYCALAFGPVGVQANHIPLKDDANDKPNDMSPEAQRVYKDLMHQLKTEDFKDDVE